MLSPPENTITGLALAAISRAKSLFLIVEIIFLSGSAATLTDPVFETSITLAVMTYLQLFSYSL